MDAEGWLMMEAYYESIQIANKLLLESKAYSYNGMKCDRFHRRTQLCVPNLINPLLTRKCAGAALFLLFLMLKVVHPDDVGGGPLVVPRVESAPASSKH